MWAGSFNPDVFDPAAADARAMLTRQSVLQQAQEQFFRDFRDAAGHAWDVFATRGKAALALLSTIGRNMFQSFATGLFTGAKGGGGGILGAAGNIGSSLGVSTGLAGLFTGGAAAGSVVPLAAVQAGWVPSLPIVGATGGGIGGALGLSGGAGLLGLGAATIPVIGGAILGGFLLGKALFGRKTLEAPFTMDPNSIERNRSVFFFTGMTDALDRLNRTLGRFDTMQPGPLVMEGLPVALGSSNQWRRNVSSVLLDDEL
jgi:hypothetical protein